MIQKITLLELNKSIQETIKLHYSESIWVVAEISELKINRSGHCYLELIEKDAVTDHIIAKTRATIWAFTFRMLKPYFESTTGYEFSQGLKILVQASVEFHELYGYSLNITDVDPNYTLGDLAQKKAEIIRKLDEDGVLDMNKEIGFPIVPQRIAIISSDTAAGYQDFTNQLNNNSYGFKFYTKLFPSVMQGMQAEQSIIQSLEKIYKYEELFDVVVIIRGGGSQADLNCFDSYLLASNIAQFPLPILTGIGHDKDESIVDIVAYHKLKTPTAVAEFILEKTSAFVNNLELIGEKVSDILFDYIDNQKTLLNHYASIAIPLAKNTVEKKNSHLKIAIERLQNRSKKSINNKKDLLNSKIIKIKIKSESNFNKKVLNLHNASKLLKSQLRFNFKKNYLSITNSENKLELLNPENILKRGYSITYLNGKKVSNYLQLKENDEIITKLFSGFIRSSVSKKSKNDSIN